MGPFLISSVNIALPDIQQAFGADVVLLSWIATAYLLSIAAVLVPAGKIADHWGRARIFALDLGILSIASIGSAMAPSITILIATQIFQGTGAAMVVTTGLLAGGLLTQHGSWRLIFVVVVPLNVLTLFLTLRYLPREPLVIEKPPFDIPGTLLYAISLVMLAYGASRLPAILAWGSSEVVRRVFSVSFSGSCGYPIRFSKSVFLPPTGSLPFPAWPL